MSRNALSESVHHARNALVSLQNCGEACLLPALIELAKSLSDLAEGLQDLQTAAASGVRRDEADGPVRMAAHVLRYRRAPLQTSQNL